MRYVLNVSEQSNRILSACVMLPNRTYGSRPIVNSLPNGNLYDYRYENDGYIYDPIPRAVHPSSIVSQETRLSNIESQIQEQELAYQKGVNSI